MASSYLEEGILLGKTSSCDARPWESRSESEHLEMEGIEHGAGRSVMSEVIWLRMPWGKLKKKKISHGFPGGSVVKNPPLEQETRVCSWSREMPHVAGQLSPAATAIGPVLSSPSAAASEACVPWSPPSTTRAAPTVSSSGTATREEPPLAITREKPVRQRGPSTGNVNEENA